MTKSTSLRWALLASGVVFSVLGLGSCGGGSGLTSLLPLLILGSLVKNSSTTSTST